MLWENQQTKMSKLTVTENMPEIPMSMYRKHEGSNYIQDYYRGVMKTE